MKKIILFCLILISSFSFFVSPALADDEIRKMELDLKTKGFTQSEWKDNLESRDIIFAPNDKFQIQLIIKNLGNRNQTQIKVKQTLPANVTSDSLAEFTIPQIVAGQDYVKNITITVRDRQYVYSYLKNSSIRFTAKSEAGTESGDYTSFFTNNGTKTADTSATTNSGLPATGTASTLIFGSAIASILGFTALKLRRFARGY